MRLAFVNRNAHDYDPDTPFVAPLAGGESAQVYLAGALAARGHEVHLFNGTSRPGRVRGVVCRNIFTDPPEREAASFDAIVVSNAPNFPMSLRQAFGPRPLIIAWPQDIWHPDPKVHGRLAELTGPRDFILCVSRWYQRHIMAAGGIPEERTRVMGHAIAPHFQGLFAPGASVLDAKPDPATPILAFASSPYKGLGPALAIFKALWEREPAAILRVFSGFDHYPPSNVFRATEGQWRPLFEDCAATPGVEVVGVVPQARLARELRAAHVFFYPNVVPEGYGVVVAEAMAAGCQVVATRMAALPETMAGFGAPVDLVGGQVRSEPFIAATLAAIRRFRERDPELAVALRAQVDHANAAVTWAARAAEFEGLLGA